MDRERNEVVAGRGVMPEKMSKTVNRKVLKWFGQLENRKFCTYIQIRF